MSGCPEGYELTSDEGNHELGEAVRLHPHERFKSYILSEGFHVGFQYEFYQQLNTANPPVWTTQRSLLATSKRNDLWEELWDLSQLRRLQRCILAPLGGNTKESKRHLALHRGSVLIPWQRPDLQSLVIAQLCHSGHNSWQNYRIRYQKCLSNCPGPPNPCWFSSTLFCLLDCGLPIRGPGN